MMINSNIWLIATENSKKSSRTIQVRKQMLSIILLCCRVVINSGLRSGLRVTELMNTVPDSGEKVIIRNGNLGGWRQNSERVMAII